MDYYAELNTWVQRAILEAEKNKDFNKKNQFLILLEDLWDCPRMDSTKKDKLEKE